MSSIFYTFASPSKWLPKVGFQSVSNATVSPTSTWAKDVFSKTLDKMSALPGSQTLGQQAGKVASTAWAHPFLTVIAAGLSIGAYRYIANSLRPTVKNTAQKTVQNLTKSAKSPKGILKSTDSSKTNSPLEPWKELGISREDYLQGVVAENEHSSSANTSTEKLAKPSSSKSKTNSPLEPWDELGITEKEFMKSLQAETEHSSSANTSTESLPKALGSSSNKTKNAFNKDSDSIYKSLKTESSTGSGSSLSSYASSNSRYVPKWVSYIGGKQGKSAYHAVTKKLFTPSSKLDTSLKNSPLKQIRKMVNNKRDEFQPIKLSPALCTRATGKQFNNSGCYVASTIHTLFNHTQTERALAPIKMDYNPVQQVIRVHFPGLFTKTADVSIKKEDINKLGLSRHSRDLIPAVIEEAFFQASRRAKLPNGELRDPSTALKQAREWNEDPMHFIKALYGDNLVGDEFELNSTIATGKHIENSINSGMADGDTIHLLLARPQYSDLGDEIVTGQHYYGVSLKTDPSDGREKILLTNPSKHAHDAKTFIEKKDAGHLEVHNRNQPYTIERILKVYC